MPSNTQYGWKPSFTRLVSIDPQAAVARGYVAPSTPPQWPAKDPRDLLDFTIDIGQDLIGNEGDVISTIAVQISPGSPGDLTLISSYISGTLATLWLAEGSIGTTYQVSVTIMTNSGRTLARSIFLPVLDLSGIIPVPGAITDQTGAPITDQTGEPLTVA